MQIFTIGGNSSLVPLTVDTTLVTVDTTQITVDTTYTSAYGYVINLIPRFTSQNIRIWFYNELTSTTDELEVFQFQYEGERLIVRFNYDFKEGDSIEITIKDADGRLMRRDKGYATAQTDLENFKLIPPNNNGIIIMD